MIMHFPVSLEELVSQPLPLSERQMDWFRRLCSPTDGIGLVEGSLGWAGQALVGVADQKWTEARDTIKKSKAKDGGRVGLICVCVCTCVGVASPPVSCECWYLAALLHLYHHDYKEAEIAAENGCVTIKVAMGVMYMAFL